MRHATFPTLALALALLGSVRPVCAHGEMVRSTPQAGSVVSTSPAEIRIQFTEGIEARFSGLEVTGPDGKRVATGRAQVEGSAMAVPLSKPLAPGRYRVNWHVLSVDSHRTKGSFTFEVRP